MGCGISHQANDSIALLRSHAALVQEYELGPMLGEGAHGTVHACTQRSTGKSMAVKVAGGAAGSADVINREADVLGCIAAHPNVVRLHGTYFDEHSACMVMDRHSGGSLVDGMRRWVRKKGGTACTALAHCSSQMADAVRHLHDGCIVHRDIKGDNFLVDRSDIADPNCHVVLADFGSAQHLASPIERLSKGAGTRLYWAPEVYTGSYGLKSDIWALGMAIWWLLAGGRHQRRGGVSCEDDTDEELPLPAGSMNAPAQSQQHWYYSDLIRGMLRRDEARRLSAKAVMVHPWIVEVLAARAWKAEQHAQALTSCKGAERPNNPGRAWAPQQPAERIHPGRAGETSQLASSLSSRQPLRLCGKEPPVLPLGLLLHS